MQSNKFKTAFFLLLLSTSAVALERFSPKACLEASYKNKISHKGFLFGLVPHEMVIEKKNCVINIHQRRYLPREWVIDVCREPVHIKVTSVTGVDVAKKVEDCVKADKSRGNSDFCSQYFDLMDVIQDDGLIFAEGDRDSLYTSHGKTYCSYLLIQRYLGDSMMFSRYTDVPDIFDKTTMTSPPLPASAIPKQAPAPVPIEVQKPVVDESTKP